MTATTEIKAILYERPADIMFSPFLENRSFCQLPIGGKPLIQYWCEHLKLIGIHELDILVRTFPEKVRKFVGAGERWGIKINVISLPLRSNLKATLRQARALMDDQVFMADIAQLPVKVIPRYEQLKALLDVQTIEAASLEADFYGPALVTPENLSACLNADKAFEFQAYLQPMKRLASPKDLWQLNMDWLHKRLDDPLPKGFVSEEGVTLGVGVQIKQGFEFRTPCHVGNYSLIEEKNRIGPNMVIGDSCIVDHTTMMADSLVMDDTYIGSHSNLNHVIVDGALLYDIRNDVQTWIDDPAIIASIGQQANRVSIFEKLMALLVLTVTAPVWLLMLLIKGKVADNTQDQSVVYLPAGRDLTGLPIFKQRTVTTLKVKHRYWRKILWLLAVLKGDLRLIGITAFTRPASDLPIWADDLKKQRSGVMSLTDIEGILDPNDDLRYVTDNYYLATRLLRVDVKIFARWILALLRPDPVSKQL